MYVAETFWERLKGVKKITTPCENDVLIIPNCSSVHTFGLKKMIIDVIFTDKHGKILKKIDNIKRNRILYGPSRTQHTIEIIHTS